jgi:hypothetical protein
MSDQYHGLSQERRHLEKAAAMADHASTRATQLTIAGGTANATGRRRNENEVALGDLGVLRVPASGRLGIRLKTRGGPGCLSSTSIAAFAAARQYLAFADMVGGGDDAFRFHPFDNPSCAVVADLKVALHKARRSLAFAAHHRDGLRI